MPTVGSRTRLPTVESTTRTLSPDRSRKGHGKKPPKHHQDLNLTNKWYISSNMHYLMRNSFHLGKILNSRSSTTCIYSLFDALQNKCFNLLNCDATLFPGFRNSKFYIGKCFSLPLKSFWGLYDFTRIKIC